MEKKSEKIRSGYLLLFFCGAFYSFSIPQQTWCFIHDELGSEWGHSYLQLTLLNSPSYRNVESWKTLQNLF